MPSVLTSFSRLFPSANPEAAQTGHLQEAAEAKSRRHPRFSLLQFLGALFSWVYPNRPSSSEVERHHDRYSPALWPLCLSSVHSVSQIRSSLQLQLNRLGKFFLLPLLAFAVALTGCKDKPAEPVPVTRVMRAEAANLVSEAEFAMQLRDFARAEPLLAKAVEVTPDDADYWVLLGNVRRRLGQTDGARTAYRRALAAYESDYSKDATDVGALLQRIYVHALLGEVPQARTLLEQAAKDHPTDRDIQGFVRARGLDQMLADPAFKETAL